MAAVGGVDADAPVIDRAVGPDPLVAARNDRAVTLEGAMMVGGDEPVGRRVAGSDQVLVDPIAAGPTLDELRVGGVLGGKPDRRRHDLGPELPADRRLMVGPLVAAADPDDVPAADGGREARERDDLTTPAGDD